MALLIVGSIALDTVKTPVEEHADLLGGSASYAALGASFFSPVKLVGIVGDDFPASEFDFWKSRGISAEGVQRVAGKTFRWSGEYAWDMNTRETRFVSFFFFQAEDGIRATSVTGVQTCALPICALASAIEEPVPASDDADASGVIFDPDRDLVDRAAAGDRNAFEALLRRHYDRIHRSEERRVGKEWGDGGVRSALERESEVAGSM